MAETEWLAKLLEQTGRSKGGLAKALGIPNSGVTRLLQGERRFRVDELSTVAQYLGITRGQLNELMGESGGWLPIETPVYRPDLPVHSTLAGDGGTFQMTAARHRTDRPSELNSVEDAHGFYVCSPEMHPAFNVGDIAIVDPSRPAGTGDDVVFVHRDGKQKLLRRLLTPKPGAWTVEQFTPPRTYDLSTKDWPTGHRVFGIRRRS